MAQVINTNIASLNAQRNLNSSQGALQTALQRLSSGLRINSAKDDAAGLAISERFTAQIRGLNQAVRNANDGISLAQTAEGALAETVNSLQRIRELAVQSANDTNSASDRASLQGEVSQLVSEIQRIASTTQFNGQNVRDGSLTSAKFQVGANANQTINVSIGSAESTTMGSHQAASSARIGTATLAAADDLAGGNGVDGGDLTLSGSMGEATVTVAANASASAIAEQVNGVLADTGISATARTEATITAVEEGGQVSFTLNGSTVSANVTDASDLSSLAEAINNRSAATGVTAELTDNGASIELVHASGDDITILDATGPGATSQFSVEGVAVGATGTDSIVIGGEVSFSSSKAFSFASADTDFVTGGGASSALESVADVSVTSQTDASDALAIIDGALEYVNGLRADLGAVQSRFEGTIANLSTTAENLSAARSRILDADFAAETAALTRAQILQQAGTSVLAQANQTPQNVLALLQ